MPLSGYKDDSCVSFRQGNWSGKIAATSGRGNIFAQRAESSRTRDRTSLLVVAESLSWMADWKPMMQVTSNSLTPFLLIYFWQMMLLQTKDSMETSASFFEISLRVKATENIYSCPRSRRVTSSSAREKEDSKLSRLNGRFRKRTTRIEREENHGRTNGHRERARENCPSGFFFSLSFSRLTYQIVAATHDVL